MKTIEDYLENNDQNNRMIQKGLRELDVDSLYDLCSALKDDKTLIMRNLSPRVADEVRAYLDANEDKIPEHAKRRAYFKYSKILLYLENNKTSFQFDQLSEKLDFSSVEEIQKSLFTVFHYNVKGDLKKLHSLIGDVDDSYIRSQLETILYGFDPMKGEYHIDRMQQRKIAEEKRRLDLLKEGILSILSEEGVERLIERLNA